VDSDSTTLRIRIQRLRNEGKNVPFWDAPDTVFAGYPANPKAGYRISSRIFVLTNTGIFLVKYKIFFLKL
jgi:hypothetical protein